MLAQTYNALHIGADRLVAMGTRAVLEMAIVKTCGDHRSFKANVAEFVRQGFMNAKLKDTILEALDFGSAAIHRGYKTELEVISDVFGIIESLIYATFVDRKSVVTVQSESVSVALGGRHRSKKKT